MLLSHSSMIFNVRFFETTLFSLSFTKTSQRENDDILVYFVTTITPTLTPSLIKPPINEVYSQHQNPLV